LPNVSLRMTPDMKKVPSRAYTMASGRQKASDNTVKMTAMHRRNQKYSMSPFPNSERSLVRVLERENMTWWSHLCRKCRSARAILGGTYGPYFSRRPLASSDCWRVMRLRKAVSVCNSLIGSFACFQTAVNDVIGVWECAGEAEAWRAPTSGRNTSLSCVEDGASGTTCFGLTISVASNGLIQPLSLLSGSARCLLALCRTRGIVGRYEHAATPKDIAVITFVIVLPKQFACLTCMPWSKIQDTNFLWITIHSNQTLGNWSHSISHRACTCY
jgi:hypothetical protein